MKLNNKGFAISSMMYIVLVLAVILIALTLASLSNRKLILDKLKSEVLADIHDDRVCWAVKHSLTGNVAKNDSNGNRIYTLGDEYLCEVKEGVKYTFFVISVESDKVNFIMNRNINNDGTVSLKGISQLNLENGIYNIVPWISEEDYASANTDSTVCNSYSCVDEGPITAMNFLNKATESWNNLDNLNEEVTIKRINDNIEFVQDITKFNLKGKARLPYNSEIIASGCKAKISNTCPLWMVNYLSANANYTHENKTSIPVFVGYWSLDVNNLVAAWSVGSGADVWGTYAYVTTSHGIRPVISVSKDKIK